MIVGSDLRNEPHMKETEMGRLREGFNSLSDSLYGVFAGIVDAEKKRNPTLRYDGGWWDTYGMFLKDEYSRCVLYQAMDVKGNLTTAM